MEPGQIAPLAFIAQIIEKIGILCQSRARTAEIYCSPRHRSRRSESRNWKTTKTAEKCWRERETHPPSVNQLRVRFLRRFEQLSSCLGGIFEPEQNKTRKQPITVMVVSNRPIKPRQQLLLSIEHGAKERKAGE